MQKQEAEAQVGSSKVGQTTQAQDSRQGEARARGEHSKARGQPTSSNCRRTAWAGSHVGQVPFQVQRNGQKHKAAKQEGVPEVGQKEAVATVQRTGGNWEPTTRAWGSHVGTAPFPGEGRQHRESARKEKQGESKAKQP